MIKNKVKSKKGRVIIRNLSFKATDEVLRNNFSKFGEISEIIIPKKPDGKMRGFGFVQFEKTASAIKAINALNAKEILGRPVAIDFAIPKDKFKEIKTPSPHPEQKETKNVKENYISTKSKDSSSEDDDSNEEGPSNRKRETKQSKSNEDSDTDDSNQEDSPVKMQKMKSRPNSDSESDSSDSDDSDDEDHRDKKRKQSRPNDDTEDDSSSDEEDLVHKKRKIKQSSLNNDSDEGVPSDKKKKTKLSRPSDVNEGRTLFIRNLSFDTSAEELKETMSKYGAIKYCLLCKDPLTEYPKGTAFVQFINKEDAEKCLEDNSAKDTTIVLGGRMLNVVMALTHDDIKRQREATIKKGKDNRNLKLETEGLIRPGSEAAEGVSQADLTKRLQLEKYKRKLLKNLNYFISPVRLSVHNIPPHFDDNKLRKIFLKAAGPGALVIETRIMRNFKKLDETGVGLSKGFAFVGFTKHEHALQALRKLNNNPDIFSPHKRPIVEFSVENRLILNAKRRQIERQNKRPFQSKRTDNHPNANNLKIQEKKQQQQLGNRKKKFSKPFKPNKTRNQQPDATKKLKVQKRKKRFQDGVRKKQNKNFQGDGKKRKNSK